MELFGISAETLKWGYRKLKAHYYRETGSNYIKQKIIEFEKHLTENTFEQMALDLRRYGEKGFLDSFVSYRNYPKKNSFSQKMGSVYINGYNSFIDVPIPLLILDVIFTLNIISANRDKMNGAYAFKFAPELRESKDLLKNAYLFEYYWNGYKKWDNIPLDSFRKNKTDSRTVLKMDLEGCFYHARFNFKETMKNLRIDGNVSGTMYNIYRRYTELVFPKKIWQKEAGGLGDGEVILPIGLLSSTVLLNIFFYDFDARFLKNKDVISYGRFVDDFYIVFKSEETVPLEKLLGDYVDVDEKRNKCELKRFGAFNAPLPINQAKTYTRFLCKENAFFKKIENDLPSFVPDYEIREWLGRKTIQITDSDIKEIRSKIDDLDLGKNDDIAVSLDNMTDCDLLNAYLLWPTIFKIAANDKQLKGPFFERIQSAIKKLPDNLSYDVKKSLLKDYNFARDICDKPANQLAFMYYVTDDDIQDVIKHKLREPNDNGSVAYEHFPKKVTLCDLSFYFSMKEKCLYTSLFDDVKEAYERINVTAYVKQNVEIRRDKPCLNGECHIWHIDVLTGARNPKTREYAIALGCIPMKHFDGENSIEDYADKENFGKLSEATIFAMKRLVDIAAKENAKYLLLPEFAVNLRDVLPFAKHCMRKNISAVFGVGHFVDRSAAYNLTCIYEAGSKCIFVKPKNYIPLEEDMIVERAGYSIRGSKPPVYYIVDDGCMCYSTMTCYEATNIKDRAKLAGKIECLFVPVYNRDTNYFSNIVESYSRDASMFIAQANCNGYGDSRIRGPYKTVKADLVKTKGGINTYSIIGKVDLGGLKKGNDMYLLQKTKKEKYEGDVKPLSAGDIHFTKTSNSSKKP